MGPIKNILFPVDFSQSCVAMGAYVKRVASVLGASVSLIHVFDPNSHSGLELSVRTVAQIAEEHLEIARDELEAFLHAEFPPAQYPRIVTAGEPAIQIADAARTMFDLIIMPTHAGRLQQMLFGSTTATVLYDADRPVLTSRHAKSTKPRPLEHREWLCAIGMDHDSERVLRFAHRASLEAHANLRIIHAIPAETQPSIQLDLEGQLWHEERSRAREWIDDLQQRAGSNAPVRDRRWFYQGRLLEAAAESEADVLVMGKGRDPGHRDDCRDLTYGMVRDSPFPVLIV